MSLYAVYTYAEPKPPTPTSTPDLAKPEPTATLQDTLPVFLIIGLESAIAIYYRSFKKDNDLLKRLLHFKFRTDKTPSSQLTAKPTNDATHFRNPFAKLYTQIKQSVQNVKSEFIRAVHKLF